MIKALQYSKQLEAVGLSREQAEVHLRILTDVIEGEMATKYDLQKLTSELKTEISAVRSELKADIQGLRAEMQQLESKMTIKLGLMQAASVAVLTAVIKWF